MADPAVTGLHPGFSPLYWCSLTNYWCCQCTLVPPRGALIALPNSGSNLLINLCPTCPGPLNGAVITETQHKSNFESSLVLHFSGIPFGSLSVIYIFHLLSYCLQMIFVQFCTVLFFHLPLRSLSPRFCITCAGMYAHTCTLCRIE